MARKERAEHQAKYPNWTARDNYAINQKKKKKKRDKSADGGELSINFVATCGPLVEQVIFFFSFSLFLLVFSNFVCPLANISLSLLLLLLFSQQSLVR